MELSSLQTSIISLIGVIASLAVGFGAFSSTTEQLVVSAAGTVVAVIFQIVTEVERSTRSKAAMAAPDYESLRRIAKPGGTVAP